MFNGVSEVMHFISHIYHAISDLRVAFSRQPPRSFQSRPCLLQGTILHTAHSVTTTSSNAAPPPPAPSSQQPTSTQTTTTNQSIPSVRALRVDCEFRLILNKFKNLINNLKFKCGFSYESRRS